MTTSREPQPQATTRRLLIQVGAAIGLLVVGSLLASPRTSWLGQQVATFLTLAGVYTAVRAFLEAPRELVEGDGRRARLLRRLADVGPLLFVVAAALVMMWPVVEEGRPVSNDHAMHLGRAWHFADQMLSEGRLSGWSDYLFAGWPAGEDYPPTGDWWVTLWYGLTLGLGGWSTAYAAAVVAMLALVAASFYTFGRTYLSRGAGVVAALLFLSDKGGHGTGGWFYTIEFGVWPQTLALGLLLLALSSLDRVLRRGGPGDHALAGALLGLALLSHPMMMIYALATVVALAVLRPLVTGEPAGRVVLRVALVLGLGVGLAAFWLLPYSAKADWMVNAGDLWRSLDKMGELVWRGEVFDAVLPPVTWLAIAGGVLAVLRRQWMALALLVAIIGLMTLASSTAFVELGLADMSDRLARVQFRRFSIGAKAFAFLLAGWAAAEVVASVRSRARATASTSEVAAAGTGWRSWAVPLVVLAACAPWVEAVHDAWEEGYGDVVGEIETEAEQDIRPDYDRFLAWSKGIRLEERQEGFYRIAYLQPGKPINPHLFQDAMAFNATPQLALSTTPATTFKARPTSTSDANLARLSVKYLVRVDPLSAGRKSLQLYQQFGRIHVYRFQDYSPQRYTLSGPGRVTVEAFDSRAGVYRFRLEGTDETSRLTLHVAEYPNWQATHDGRPLPITRAKLDGYDFYMQVPARDGVIELVYGTAPINLASAVVSWLALLILLGLTVAARVPALRASRLITRLGPLAARAERWGVVVALAGAALAMVGRSALPKHDLGLPARHEAPVGERLRGHLRDARVEVVGKDGEAKACEQARADHFACDAKRAWNFVGATVRRLEGHFYECIWAHPVKDRTLRVTFPDLELGQALHGDHMLDDRAGRHRHPVDLKVRVGGTTHAFKHPGGPSWKTWEVDTSERAGEVADVVLEVSARNTGMRHYCFRGAIVR